MFFKGSADPSTEPFGFVGVNGSTETLQATPDPGSAFAGWSGACSGTGDCIVAPADNANVTVTATFAAL